LDQIIKRLFCAVLCKATLRFLKITQKLSMNKLGYFLAFVVLVSMTIPASAQNPSTSDKELKIREEVLACWIEIDSDDESTTAEKTVAKRDCETKITNKYQEVINDDFRERAESKNRIEVIQKCEDWYPTYRLLSEDQWKLQKNADQANDCMIVYNDYIWKYQGNDRTKILVERLLELKEGITKLESVEPSIEFSLESNVVSQDNRFGKIAELEAKVAELQEELRKKDQVLKEQIRVIMDLANMLRNVVLEPFLANFIHF